MKAIYGSPRMEGEIDQIWEQVDWHELQVSSGATATTARVKLIWDDYALYVLAAVEDAELNADSPVAYFQDSLEVFVDEANDRTNSYQADDLHFRVNFENKKTADSGDLTRLYARTKVTGSGYFIEARIALTEMPSNDQVIGIDFQVNDADQGGKRIGTLSLFDQTGEAYRDPSLFGQVILIGKKAGDQTGLNRYELLAYLDYVETINQAVYLNGAALNVAIEAATKLVGRDDVGQTEIDQALAELKLAVADLRRSDKYEEPHRLPKLEEMPDLLSFEDGSEVRTEADWWKRADQLRDLYQFYMYGYMPDTSAEKVSFEKTESGMTIKVSNDDREAEFFVTVTLPGEDCQLEAPYPVIITNGGLDLAFDEETLSFVRPTDLPLEDFVNRRGYAVITIKPRDVAADNSSRTGAFFDLYPYSETDNDVGTLVAWAWGAGKVVDALEQNAYPEISPNQVGVTGFSRFGKAALVAGALDDRFALVNPHASGLGGMASFRHSFAGKKYPWGIAGPPEGLGSLQSSALRHWFTTTFLGFDSSERLPFDQHQLSALIAPRGLILTSGYADHHTNPEGMYEAYLEASKVYELLDAGDNIGIAYRQGSHTIELEDIERLLDFGDQLFRKIKPVSDFKTTLYQD